MEYKTVKRVELKRGQSGPGTLAGYASTYDTDSVNERIVPGAFVNLREFAQDGFLALGHSWESLPIGFINHAREEPGKGLYFEATFHGTTEAQNVRTVVQERLARGKSAGLSIGYSVLKDRQALDGVRELLQVKLFEISVVSVPANRAAGVESVKGGQRRANRAELEALMRAAARNGVRLPGNLNQQYLMDDVRATLAHIENLLGKGYRR